jgi:hypothetical protein
LNILNFPGITPVPLEDAPLFTSAAFMPLPTSSSPVPGVLVDNVEYGAFKLSWQVYNPHSTVFKNKAYGALYSTRIKTSSHILSRYEQLSEIKIAYH